MTALKDENPFFFLVFVHFGKLLLDSGIFVEVKSTKQTCIHMQGIQGPEDFAVVDNYMFISSTYLPYRHNFERHQKV